MVREGWTPPRREPIDPVTGKFVKPGSQKNREKLAQELHRLRAARLQALRDGEVDRGFDPAMWLRTASDPHTPPDDTLGASAPSQPPANVRPTAGAAGQPPPLPPALAAAAPSAPTAAPAALPQPGTPGFARAMFEQALAAQASTGVVPVRPWLGAPSAPRTAPPSPQSPESVDPVEATTLLPTLSLDDAPPTPLEERGTDAWTPVRWPTHALEDIRWGVKN